MTDPMQARRFEDDPGWGEASGRAEVPLAGVARGRLPNRVQRELRARDRESLLPAGHRARRVWAWVERADLGALYASIRAVAGGSGRTAMAPEILFGRWLYATLEGVGSARALARLTQEHDAYRWICGGASVTDHPLAAFRRAQGAAFDALLPESVAVLLAAGVVSLKRVAQEGLRVRASAGAAAFRRGATLEACLEQAREQVEQPPVAAPVELAAHVVQQQHGHLAGTRAQLVQLGYLQRQHDGAAHSVAPMLTPSHGARPPSPTVTMANARTRSRVRSS